MTLLRLMTWLTYRNMFVFQKIIVNAAKFDNKPCGCDVETEIYSARSRNTFDNSTLDNLFDMIHGIYVTAWTQTKFRSVVKNSSKLAKEK